MRAVRILFRLARHGHLDDGRRYGIFQLARLISRFLPASDGLRRCIRSLLARWQYGHAGWPGEYERHDPKVLPGDAAAAERSAQHPDVDAGLCGLAPGLVSVILPVYNQAALLDESVRSVLAQSYRNFELIIIDDGSTDEVQAVLQPYLHLPRVRCISQTNHGLPHALNRGFAQARGEFWTWTSADNAMAPTMLETLVAALDARPGPDMVYADYLAIDDRGLPLADPLWLSHRRPDPASAAIRLPHSAEALNSVLDNFIGPCFMYRGWVGRCIGDYDLRLPGVEDYDYWMRINAYFELSHLGREDLLYRYRVHDNSLTARAEALGIPARIRWLMAYEKERARYHRALPSFLVDGLAMAWLQGAPGHWHRVPWQAGGPIKNATGCDWMVLVSCAQAAGKPDDLARVPGPVAILLEQGSPHVMSLQSVLTRPDCMALVSCHAVAAQVRQLAPACTIMDAGSGRAFTALHAFMKNRWLLSRMHAPGARACRGGRVLPEPLT